MMLLLQKFSTLPTVYVQMVSRCPQKAPLSTVAEFPTQGLEQIDRFLALSSEALDKSGVLWGIGRL
jgi:hypothetical protein